MRISKIYIWLVLLSVLLCSAYADYTVKSEPLNDEIFPGEVAEYEITLKNTGEDQITLEYEFAEDPSWSVITDPVYHQGFIRLDPGEEKQTVLKIKPDPSVDYGQKYEYNFKVVSSAGGFAKRVILDLFLRNPDRLQNYVPIVGLDVDIDSEIDPRQDAELSIILTNFNPLNITNLSLVITSKINPDNDRMLSVQLPGLEKKRLTLEMSYDPLQPPVKEQITVTASVPSRNASFEPKSKTVQIEPYAEIEQDEQTEEYFLKEHQTIKLYNDGNIQADKTLRERTTLFSQIFTSEHPKAEVVSESGYRYLEWDFSLGPQERREISLTVNYRPLFYIALLLLAAIVLYYIFRSPVILKKHASRIAGEDSSSAKVQLHISNRTGRLIENITVIDRIPHIAKLDNEFPVGTMQPSKTIRNEKKGTVLKYNIPALEPYEERILTYNIKSHLNIVGDMRFGAAMVKYRNRFRKLGKTYSNKAYAR